MMHRHGKWNENVYIECVTVCYNKLCIRVSVCIGIETEKKKKGRKKERKKKVYEEIMNEME